MKNILVLLLLALCATTAFVSSTSVDYDADLEAAFMELEAELATLSEQAPVPAPLAPAVDPAPVINGTLVKPAIDDKAALAPATEISFRPVEPVLVPYNVPAENVPLYKDVPETLKAVTIDDRFGLRKRRDPNEARVTFGPTPPANMTKAAVSKNIFGSTAVVYRRAIDRHGCPCKKAVVDNYRYDTEFKLTRRERRLKYSPKCCCKEKRFNGTQREWEQRLPVVAQLKKDWNATRAARIAAWKAKVANGTAPCFRPFNLTAPQQNITVTHYKRAKLSDAERQARRLARLAKLGCLNATNPANATVVPQFKRAPRLSRDQRKKLREVVLHPAGQLP